MRVGITGAFGAIGSRLLESCLNEGHTVSALTRDKAQIARTSSNLKIVIGDLSNEKECFSDFIKDIDILFHCAAEIKNEALMERVNVQGTKNLVQAAQNKIKHLVYLSSVGVYGSPLNGVYDELSKERPTNTYEITKVKAEHIVTDCSEMGNYKYTIFRPSKVMGVSTIDADLYKLISYIDRGIFCYMGPPGASANYIYIDNLVDALLACINDNDTNSSKYNLCDRRNLEEFIEVISGELGRKANYARFPLLPFRLAAYLFGSMPGYPLNINRINGLTTRVVYDTRKVEMELGFRHKVSIEEGLKELVKEWKKENPGRN